ncbi:hypothetical protein QCI42_29330 [Bacillus fungorum]|uniref:hypothetical protein n=1 Tax=Bacillus fungorum TaxID=2039284 RepID=UPI00339A6DB0
MRDAVYAATCSKSDTEKEKNIDEERKKRVFTQNSNVIFNSSFLTDNAARKNNVPESNDETSNTTQVTLGVALSAAITSE